MFFKILNYWESFYWLFPNSCWILVERYKASNTSTCWVVYADNGFIQLCIYLHYYFHYFVVLDHWSIFCLKYSLYTFISSPIYLKLRILLPVNCAHQLHSFNADLKNFEFFKHFCKYQGYHATGRTRKSQNLKIDLRSQRVS